MLRSGGPPRWCSLAALGLALAGCGPVGPEEATPSSGVTVVAQTSAAFASAPDFDARVHDTIDAALGYWGGTWHQLEGVTITLVDDESVLCGGRPSLGCYSGREIRLTTRDPALGTFPCVEATVLVHEVGHAVIGDGLHSDPRWMQMDELAIALGGKAGYTAAGEVSCETYVSVWRHPLNSP